MTESTKGLLYAVAAYAFWGIVPIYFKLLVHVAPLEIIAHRIVWSALTLLVIVTVARRWPALRAVATNGRSIRLLLLSALLVSANWYVFTWAVVHNQLVEASLGYFINPLVNVLLGFLVLRERLRVLEWVSVGLVTLAVGWLAIGAGVMPWVSLSVAFSFGLYGLVRKISGVPSLEGLTLETLLLLPVAGGYLVFLGANETLHLDLLLAASGPITAVPLLWFASGVLRLRLATMGLLQYISPTLQFALAIFVYGEPFGRLRLIAFGLIWCAIAIYSRANLRT